MWYVYIIECKNGSFYTGVTKNLDQRMQEHKYGRGRHFTSYAQPKGVLYSEIFENNSLAYAREKQIKGWSRAKKRALIAGHLKELRQLSISRD